MSAGWLPSVCRDGGLANLAGMLASGGVARRAAEPSYTFRRHLRQIGGAIEE
jgi:hypothetical protein